MNCICMLFEKRIDCLPACFCKAYFRGVAASESRHALPAGRGSCKCRRFRTR